DLSDPGARAAAAEASGRIRPQPRPPDRNRRAQRAAQNAGLRCSQGVRAARGRGDRQERRGRGRPTDMSAAAGAAPSIPESLVVVTGLSGSGKSYVNKSLEDMGYYCVDNLPLELVEPLLDRVTAKLVGIILDVR